MVISAAADKIISTIHEGLSHRLCIIDDLLAISPEIFGKYFTKRNRFSCNHMFQRSALRTREYCEVKQLAHRPQISFWIFYAPGIFKIMAKHNDTTSRSTQGFMCGRANNVTMIKWVI